MKYVTGELEPWVRLNGRPPHWVMESVFMLLLSGTLTTGAYPSLVEAPLPYLPKPTTSTPYLWMSVTTAFNARCRNIFKLRNSSHGLQAQHFIPFNSMGFCLSECHSMQFLSSKSLSMWNWGVQMAIWNWRWQGPTVCVTLWANHIPKILNLIYSSCAYVLGLDNNSDGGTELGLQQTIILVIG